MKISETCIRRPIFATMMIAALVVFGLVAYRTIGVNMFPEVDFPLVTVTVVNPGVAPETMETDVADPIEESVGTISGIKTLRSQSLEGITQVFIEFQLEEDVDTKAQDVRDKVALIRRDLPEEIEEPIIDKLDLDSSPILSIVLSGPVSITRLTRIADEQVKPLIETIGGVGNVRMVGDRDREVRVWLRAGDLKGLNLTAQDVIDALHRENIDLPGGRVETGSREIIVKTKGKIETIEVFRNIVVADRGGVPIRLRDVAHVEDGMEDCRSLAKLGGKRAVSLLVRRQSGKNMVAVANAVKARLGEIQELIEEQGIDLTVVQDNSIFVNQSIEEAEGELMRGAVLAVLVIFFFLRSVRGSFVAACTIPATIIGTYAFMLGLGFTVNMMTMLALTISVGMIIDDSIVVLENTYRHMEEGVPRMQAAVIAIREIGFAVVSTSLAIAAVFVPVAFMQGIVGRFFFEFGLTVTAAVAISTFIAVTFSPMLCSRVLKVSKEHGRIFNAVERFFNGIESIYGKLLGASLRMRWLVVFGAIAFFVSSMAIVPLIGQEFVPQSDEDQFNIMVEAPIGTSIEATDLILNAIEGRIESLDGVREVFTTIGSGVEERVNTATVLAKLVGKDDRNVSQFVIMDRARDEVELAKQDAIDDWHAAKLPLHELPDMEKMKVSVEIVPRVSGGGMSAAPFQYCIQGQDLTTIVAFAEKIQAKLPEAGLIDINSTWNAGKPEFSIYPDREKASLHGVSVRDIGNAIYALVGGLEATTYEDGGESFDVRVRLAEQDRERTQSILDLPVRTNSGDLVEIRGLVTYDDTEGPVQIDRQDRLRQVVINANIAEGKVLNEAMEATAKFEEELEMPPELRTRYVGDAQNMQESFGHILVSMGLAILLIYMVLAAQFESLIHPFTIMLTLPLSVTGALGALAITGRTLSIFSMIGMIMLMGLVTKNAILLVDYTNELRRRGMKRNDAVRKAGPVRLRPILMTAFSTIAGMTPVAIGLGEGAETRAPMGTCIVGGMITSTILTLIVIPVVYTILDDIGALFRRMVGLPAVGESTTDEAFAAIDNSAVNEDYSKPIAQDRADSSPSPTDQPPATAASSDETIQIGTTEATPSDETIRINGAHGDSQPTAGHSDISTDSTEATTSADTPADSDK